MKSPIGFRVEKRSKRKVFDLKDMLIGMGLLNIYFLSNLLTVGVRYKVQEVARYKVQEGNFFRRGPL